MIIAKIVIPKQYFEPITHATVKTPYSAIAQLEHTFIFAFGGFTRYETFGGFKDKEGNYIYDESFTYEIFKDEEQDSMAFNVSLMNIKANYESILNQEEVFLRVFNVGLA